MPTHTTATLLQRLAVEAARRLPMEAVERLFANAAHDIAEGYGIAAHHIAWAEHAVGPLLERLTPPSTAPRISAGALIAAVRGVLDEDNTDTDKAMRLRWLITDGTVRQPAPEPPLESFDDERLRTVLGVAVQGSAWAQFVATRTQEIDDPLVRLRNAITIEGMKLAAVRIEHYDGE